ncbi:MAG TPA: hypothetical protein VGR74_01140 [Actinomycetota bacterium]|nr:hypothetical protein [Actinomycetota bacterium]
MAVALSWAAPARAATAATSAVPEKLLADGYQRKSNRDFDGAAAAFSQARSAGADPQRVALELGYLRAALGEVGPARDQFYAAAGGPNLTLADQARREIDALPSRLWADIYADSYGWHRAAGGNPTTDLVPTVRARLHLRLTFAVDLQLYAYLQATRDVASRASSNAGVPEIYADNFAMGGAGLLLRVWQKRLGFFAQAGPAFNLMVGDGRPRLALDVRGGAFLFAESAGCRPDRAGGSGFGFWPCAELYSEGIYVSRFQHNVIGFARGGAAAGYLLTGPVAWQLLVESRAAVDRNRDYYNNFADVGGGHRWRLLGGVPIDLQAGVYAGRYFGRQGRDPAPQERRYVDLRVLAATYLEF